jgi:hypothetical protein
MATLKKRTADMAQRLNSAAFKAMPVLAEDQTSAVMICWATPLPLKIENSVSVSTQEQLAHLFIQRKITSEP